jgi:hypothetical protein
MKGEVMSHAEELYYLDVLYHYLADQYARMHDAELLRAIAIVQERSEYLMKKRSDDKAA